MKTSFCLLLVSAAFFLGGCAAMTTFDKDWRVAVDRGTRAACAEPDSEGCLFYKEYVLSGYSDRWLDEQMALGGHHELSARLFENDKAAMKSDYARLARQRFTIGLAAMGRGLSAMGQGLQQQQQYQPTVDVVQPMQPFQCQQNGANGVRCW